MRSKGLSMTWRGLWIVGIFVLAIIFSIAILSIIMNVIQGASPLYSWLVDSVQNMAGGIGGLF